MFRQASVSNARLNAIAAEENRQALMLFTVVAAFLLCNLPRIAHKLNEVINYDRIMLNYKMGCKALPIAILMIGSISHFLLAVNSSLNFFLYCLMSSSFRNELCALVTRCRIVEKTFNLTNLCRYLWHRN